MSHVRMRNNTLYIHDSIVVWTDTDTTAASNGMRAYNTIYYYRYVCIIVAGWPEARLSICGNALNENLPRASESFPVGQFPRATFSPTVCPSVKTYRYRMVRIIISRYTYVQAKKYRDATPPCGNQSTEKCVPRMHYTHLIS